MPLKVIYYTWDDSYRTAEYLKSNLRSLRGKTTTIDDGDAGQRDRQRLLIKLDAKLNFEVVVGLRFMKIDALRRGRTRTESD